MHAAQITVCRQEEGLGPQPAQKMSWENALKWIREQAEGGRKAFSCYESGPCGYGLHRILEVMGVSNIVVAPQRWDEGNQRVKTGKRDARQLVDRLDRYPLAARSDHALAAESGEFRERGSRSGQKVSSQSAGKALPKGLGSLTASLLGAEILDWNRFKNRRQVASYTRLCPSEYSSGERRRQGTITKHGNPRIRHHLVEAVWRLEV